MGQRWFNTIVFGDVTPKTPKHESQDGSKSASSFGHTETPEVIVPMGPVPGSASVGGYVPMSVPVIPPTNVMLMPVPVASVPPGNATTPRDYPPRFMPYPPGDPKYRWPWQNNNAGGYSRSLAQHNQYKCVECGVDILPWCESCRNSPYQYLRSTTN